MRILTPIVFTIMMLGASISVAKLVPSSSKESKAAEKDGLSVTVILTSPAFGADPEWPRLAVRFKNVAAADIHLCNADAIWDWKFRFISKDQPGSWLVQFEPFVLGRPISTNTLKPGETLDVPIDLNQTPRAADLIRDGIPFDKEPAPVPHLQPGQYELTVDIQLNDNHAPKTSPYWTGSITTNPIAIEAQDVKAIYGDVINRVTSKFDKFGGWKNGLFGDINLPADAEPKDFIAQAIKNVREIKTYRILDIRPVTIESSPQSARAAVIQTDVGLKVLIFYPFQDAKGWWSRFYDASLNPATKPSIDQ
jgi:hypothetical protein